MSWQIVASIAAVVMGGLFTFIGFTYKRNEQLHKESQSAITTQSTALAVLVEQVQPSIKIVNEVVDLKLASAILNQKVIDLNERLTRHGIQ